MYKWQQVKTLKRKGVSIKEIVRKLKLSKNTVKKYLKSHDPPRFNKREYKSILDSYDSLIRDMLEKKFIGTRIYDELLKAGYKGSLFTVYWYIRKIKEKEKIKKEVTTRVETLPADQMQYDWKEWILPVDGKKVKLYIHEVVLSYSRKKYYTYSLSITTPDVIRAVVSAIEYFGGVAEELVIDNPKQMVITHKKNGVIRYNDEFLRFCGLYGIEPNPCQNYRARTKGKAERPFYYLQEHLLRGLEVSSLDEFDGLLNDFFDDYNARPHSSLKESPDERFLRERGSLREVPLVEPTILYERQIRKISNDGYISWGGAFYPVPMHLCLQEVMVEAVFGRNFKVYDKKGELINEYQIRIFDKGVRPEHPEHKEMNNIYKEKREAQRSRIAMRFLETFREEGKIYVEGLKERVSANVYWHLEEIMRYTELYTVGEVSEVLSECIDIGAYHKNSVKRLLKLRKIREPEMEPFFSLHMFPSVDIKRDLSFYRMEVSHE